MDALFFSIEIIGTIAFAIAGAMVAIDKETDFFGVVFLAVVTSFGGGMLRDVMIGNIPPSFFTNYIHITVCVVSATLVFILARVAKKKYVEKEVFISAVINYFDALGLGAFAVAGTEICIKAGYTSPFIAITLGMISAVGGGMARDLILREIPFILCKRIYAVAALCGSGIYFLLSYLKLSYVLAASVSIAAVFAVRVCATVFKWSLPKAIRFSHLEESEATEEKKTVNR